jgi:hypothetical protein
MFYVFVFAAKPQTPAPTAAPLPPVSVPVQTAAPKKLPVVPSPAAPPAPKPVAPVQEQTSQERLYILRILSGLGFFNRLGINPHYR